MLSLCVGAHTSTHTPTHTMYSIMLLVCFCFPCASFDNLLIFVTIIYCCSCSCCNACAVNYLLAFLCESTASTFHCSWRTIAATSQSLRLQPAPLNITRTPPSPPADHFVYHSTAVVYLFIIIYYFHNKGYISIKLFKMKDFCHCNLFRISYLWFN